MGWFGWTRKSKAPVLHVASDVGTGPVVILVHGIASSSVTFENLVPLLAPHHRVISIDVLGFGESPSPDEAAYTMEEHVEALDATIRSLKLKLRFVLVGHSLGSLIVARYSTLHPRKLTKLVLVSPPIYVPPSAVSDPMDRAALGIYSKVYEYLRGNKEFTIKAATRLGRLSPIKNVLDVSERNWRAFVYTLQNAIESQTSVSDIAAVSVPVEVVYGTFDPFLAPAGLKIVGQMRHVTVHKVDANDHLIRPRLARVVAAAVG
ncbi:alpha/beta fold hydrolase [Salinibacterium sp. ZJ450]|uniref:alpha/beta fold hydrolase n=1 Tax=Salinibacterium sp. ZJ450 TaxID=2708338 RepID=UPI001CD6D595|nr:alpha/beta hydrolase [Salinibacterium sp. ZJ450]